MKHILNLAKIPKSSVDSLRLIAERQISRLESRLRRFSDGRARLFLIVQPGGREAKRYSARIVLKHSTDVITTLNESFDGPEVVLRAAFEQIDAKLQRHLERLRRSRRQRRKSRQQQWLQKVQPDLNAAVDAEQREVFDALLRSQLDMLYRTAEQMIEIKQAEGRLPEGVLPAAELINETMMRAWNEYGRKDENLPLDLWLTRLLRESLAAETLKSERSEPQNEVPEEPRAEPLADTDQDSDQWWSANVDRPSRILWEDLLPNEEMPESFSGLSLDDARQTLLSAITRLAQPGRDVLTLYALHGYDFAEIERVLDLPADQVEQATEQARNQLREVLEI